MKNHKYWLWRQISNFLIVPLTMLIGRAASAQQKQTFPSQQTQQSSSVQYLQKQSRQAIKISTENITPPRAFLVNPEFFRSQEIVLNQSSSTVPDAPEEQQNNTSKPLGTAAAPYEKTTGVAASKPAGAAIAPAKQKRARSILIRVGVILGVGVAVGTVIALSLESPSQPH